jgi:hypothetical protein
MDPHKQFPHIQLRKLSLHATEHPKYLIKFSKMGNNQSHTQPVSLPPERESSPEQSVFCLPPSNSFIKKRIFITPGKFSNKERFQQLLDNDVVKKQLDELQIREGLNR